MPWTVDNPPRPAINWTDEEKKKCVRAANAVLKEGGSEQDAIFACIRAAGKTKKEQDMTNSRDRRRERREAERAALRKMTDEQVDAIIVKSSGEEEQEVEQKDIYIEGASMLQSLPFGGATSWDELDQYLAAQDLANETRQATWEFQRMVENVLDKQDVSLSEKSAMISALANGLPERVSEIEEEEGEEKSWLKTITDAISGKAAMQAAAINDLPDSDFAYIETGGKKDDGGKTAPRSLRHYPIHDAAHIRNALARAAQMMKRGGKSGTIARRAMPKIRAAAKREKIGEASEEGKSIFKVFKDKTGNFRWIGFVTNKWRDRDQAAAPEKGGEILSEAAHKDMVEWANAVPEKRMPFLMAWHSKDHTHEHRADFLEYHNGFVIASGQLAQKEADSIQRISDSYNLGMSHGMYVRDGWRNKEDNTIIEKYRTFEVSYLPLEYAANPWTDFVAAVEEKSMNDERKQFLQHLMGEEFVEQVLEEADSKAATLQVEGVESKERKAPVTPKTAEPTPTPEPPDVKIDIKAMAESIAKELGFEELSKFLEAIKSDLEKVQGQVVELNKSTDEKVAETLTPRIDVEKAVIPVWKRRASQSEDNIVDVESETDQELVKGPTIKNLSWVQDAMCAPESAPVPK